MTHTYYANNVAWLHMPMLHGNGTIRLSIPTNPFPCTDVTILFPTVGLTAQENTVQVAVQLNGRIERTVNFSLETLNSLDVENYMTEGYTQSNMHLDEA